MGYKVLKKAHYDESVDEMKHADEIIKGVLFLDGVPNVSDYDPIRVGRAVREQFDNDLALEMAALEVMRQGVRLYLEGSEDASRELLEHMIKEEEHHVNWLEAQKHQIGEVGYENYPAQQIHS